MLSNMNESMQKHFCVFEPALTPPLSWGPARSAAVSCGPLWVLDRSRRRFGQSRRSLLAVGNAVNGFLRLAAVLAQRTDDDRKRKRRGATGFTAI